MDREEFLDAYYQAFSKAGRNDVWDVVEHGFTFSVVALDAEGNRLGLILEHQDEDIARWIALAHNAAEQIVDGFREALDDAERWEAERDAATHRNLELELLILDGEK